MNRVDFYVLESLEAGISSDQSQAAVFQTVSRLVQKAQSQQHQVLIFCDELKVTQALDDWLWTFDETSFVPHAIIDAQPADESPHILIATPSHHEHMTWIEKTKTDVLINLIQTCPHNPKAYKRILEIVEPKHKAEARLKYKQYQAEGAELHRHFVTSS